MNKLHSTVITAGTIAAVFRLAHTGHLDNFIALKASGISTWLKTKNLDPTPASEVDVQFSISDSIGQINFTLRNLSVQGHSIGTVKAILGIVELLNGYNDEAIFWVNFNATGNITYFGTYTANGTLYSDIPISGAGSYSISVPWVYIDGSAFTFQVSPIGPVNLTLEYPADIDIGVDWNNIYFEKLWQPAPVNEFVELIKELIFTHFERFVNGIPMEPLGKLFQQYWEEMFEVIKGTTLAHILATPLHQDRLPELILN